MASLLTEDSEEVLDVVARQVETAQHKPVWLTTSVMTVAYRRMQ